MSDSRLPAEAPRQSGAALAQPLPANGKRKAYTAGEWAIHAWGIGGIASYFMWEQFYLINNIHTTVFKVSPIAIGWILASPRLFDGILDPILGHWSDNTHSRWGRRKPFLLFSAIIGAITASTLFWMSPEWAQWLKCAFLSFSAITLFIACGTYDMTYTAFGYELSEEYSDRSRIQSIKSVYWSLMGIVGGYLIGLASDPQATGDEILGSIQGWIAAIGRCWTWAFGGSAWTPVLWNWWQSWRPTAAFDSEVTGFRVISGVISILIFVTVFFPLLFSKERYVKVNKEHVNLWKALKATLKCRPFVVILVINIASSAGTLPRNLFFYIGVYSVCHGNKAEYTNAMAGDFAVWGFLFAIVVWWITKPITKLIGKRVSFIGGAALALIQAVGTPFVATPGHIRLWFWFNLAFLPISMVLGAPASGIMPDVCDIDELENGERREGLFTAVISFVSKMQISVMTIATGFFIAWTGYNADYGGNQPQEVLDRMRWMGFTPLIAISAISFVVSCFMPITQKMMDQVRAELDKRHALSGVTEPAAS